MSENRDARRARARGKGKRTLAGFQFLLTPDEAPIVEEALHDYVRKLAEDPDRSVVQEWAMDRAEHIRAAMAAAIDGRPYRDISPQRHQPHPSPPSAQPDQGAPRATE